MNVTINTQDNKAFVILEGRLDTTNASQFQKDIEPLMNGEFEEIELDCTGMEYTSSQGLRLFLVLQKNCTAKNCRMIMKNMRPQVKEVFDITGFSHIISIQ